MKRSLIVLALLVCFVVVFAERSIDSAEEKTFATYCAQEFAKKCACA